MSHPHPPQSLDDLLTRAEDFGMFSLPDNGPVRSFVVLDTAGDCTFVLLSKPAGLLLFSGRV